jgi:SAM-dependent methyltransferase
LRDDLKVNHTQDPASRGERLYPPRTSRTYASLTLLRRAMEDAVGSGLPAGERLLALDYGCGNMPYRPLFERAGVRYVGADFPGNSLAELTVGADGQIDYPDGSCDVVVSTQVLEHVERPADYLRECCRLLRRGGRLILSAPGYWVYHPDPADYWRWTAAGLQKVVCDAGFDIVRFHGVTGPAAAAAQLFQDATLYKTPRLLRPLYVLLTQTAIMLLDHLYTPAARARDAQIYVVIAEKADPGRGANQEQRNAGRC